MFIKDMQKALDYFRKLIRAGRECSILEKDGCYWLCNGFLAIAIPAKCMELNPSIFKEQPKLEEIIFQKEIGVELKFLNLQEKGRNCTNVPFNGDGFTAWFDKTLLDIFPANSKFYSTGALNATTVKLNDEVIGILLPLRHSEELPDLFNI